MLDATRFDPMGTTEKPINQANTPGAMMTGTVIGLFYDEKRMEPSQIGTLTAQAVALTHGDPEAILAAVVLANSIKREMPKDILPERKIGTVFAASSISASSSSV